MRKQRIMRDDRPRGDEHRPRDGLSAWLLPDGRVVCRAGLRVEAGEVVWRSPRPFYEWILERSTELHEYALHLMGQQLGIAIERDAL